MSTPETKLLSANEAATILGLTQRRVNQLVKDGLLEAELIGNSHVIKTTSLADYLKSKRKKSNGNSHK